MSKKKAMQWIVSGSLLAAVTLVGVSVYQVEMNQQEQMESEDQAEVEENVAEEVHLGGNSTATVDEAPHLAVVDDEEEDIPSAETSSDQVTANE